MINIQSVVFDFHFLGNELLGCPLGYHVVVINGTFKKMVVLLVRNPPLVSVSFKRQPVGWGGGGNQHMENSICFVVFIFESFPYLFRPINSSQLSNIQKL